jgi:hypothetical protein
LFDPTKPYVIVTLDEGKQSVDAHNFTDKTCEKAVSEIHKILGGDIVSSVSKPVAAAPAAAKPQVVAR